MYICVCVCVCVCVSVCVCVCVCPDDDKGCSVRDLVITESCREENLLSNDIKYVMIALILTELHIPEHTTVGTHRNRKMPNYLPFIDILGGNP